MINFNQYPILVILILVTLIPNPRNTLTIYESQKIILLTELPVRLRIYLINKDPAYNLDRLLVVRLRRRFLIVTRQKTIKLILSQRLDAPGSYFIRKSKYLVYISTEDNNFKYKSLIFYWMWISSISGPLKSFVLLRNLKNNVHFAIDKASDFK